MIFRKFGQVSTGRKHSARAQLRSRPDVLQARRGPARRNDLGARARKAKGSAFYVQLPLTDTAERRRAQPRSRSGARRSAADEGLYSDIRLSCKSVRHRSRSRDARAERRRRDCAIRVDADVAVFNSCTVTAAAEADLRGDIRAAARARQALRTIVMGCAPACRSRDERVAPLATLPTVDAAIAGADLEAIAAALGITAKRCRHRVGSQTGARALLRIQDGCDEHCTFCATTLSRGANRSRSIESISSRKHAHLPDVHPEIVLTGIHIGTYGRDIGSIAFLTCRSSDRRVPRVRFRLTSIEATEVDDKLGRAFARRIPRVLRPTSSCAASIRIGRAF